MDLNKLKNVQRSLGQKAGKEKRKYSKGRKSADDDSGIAIAVYTSGNIIKIDFGKPTEWVGFGPQDAVDLAQVLIKHARKISKEPLAIDLGDM